MLFDVVHWLGPKKRTQTYSKESLTGFTSIVLYYRDFVMVFAFFLKSQNVLRIN